MFDINSEIAFSYPITTHVLYFENCRARFRQVIIKDVRDLVHEPLTVDEFLRRPFINRSRYLIRAFEPGNNTWRQFYLGSSIEFRSPGSLRLAVFQPGESRPIEYIGREFHSCTYDRRVMIRLIQRWQRTSHGELQLKIIANDLRITS